jgi:hypothetical protein
LIEQLEIIPAILHRAANDPAFLEQFAADPLGVLVANGAKLPLSTIKYVLGMPAATDQEIVEVLLIRTEHSRGIPDCGDCGPLQCSQVP